ncbi:hypothetical protein [Thermovibrio ammonificans]
MKEEELFEIADDYLDELQENVRSISSAVEGKGVKIKVAPEGEKRREKLESLVSAARQLYDSRADIKEILYIAKALKEADAEANRIALELQREIAAVEMRRERLREFSQRLKELIEVYKEQLNAVMKIVNALPAETQEQFARKLALIDRCNALLSELSRAVMKLLTA